jgi:hypothetical protein
MCFRFRFEAVEPGVQGLKSSGKGGDLGFETGFELG